MNSSIASLVLGEVPGKVPGEVLGKVPGEVLREVLSSLLPAGTVLFAIRNSPLVSSFPSKRRCHYQWHGLGVRWYGLAAILE